MRNNSANSFKASNTRAIFKRDSIEILPVLSNFLITEKLTPERLEREAYVRFKESLFFLARLLQFLCVKKSVSELYRVDIYLLGKLPSATAPRIAVRIMMIKLSHIYKYV